MENKKTKKHPVSEVKKKIFFNHFEDALVSIDGLLDCTPDIEKVMEAVHRDFQRELVRSLSRPRAAGKNSMQAMGNMLYHFGMILRSRKISRGKKLDVNHEKK